MTKNKYNNLKIALISPSGKLGDMEILTKKSIEILEEIGAQIIYSKVLEPDLFHAGKLESRILQFEEALTSDADILWTIMGGYGAMQLLDFLDEIPIPEKFKVLVGYSDITALNIFFNQIWNWPVIHGDCPGKIVNLIDNYKDENSEKFDSFKKNMILRLKKIMDIIIDKNHILNYKIFPMNNLAKNYSEHLITSLIGGNLAVTCTTLATNWQINSKEKILFFEDVDERAYRIDRMLLQLMQANIINDSAGIIFGDFAKCGEQNGKNHVDYVLNNFANSVQKPVWRIKGCGHAEENHPLILGGKAEIRNNMLELKWH